MVKKRKKAEKSSRVKTRTSKISILEARSNYRLYLIENTNYFGSVSKLDISNPQKLVYKLLSNKSYEELTCIGFNPDTNELNGVVVVKKKSGYSGGPCTDGSKEYVRFYLDYEGTGTWIDEGVVNFDAHDLPFNESLCYDVKIKIDPDKLSCCDEKAVLPKVRAILSWNQEPPAGQPNWTSTWGNVLDDYIQIDPRWGIWCWLKDNIKFPIDATTLMPKELPIGLKDG